MYWARKMLTSTVLCIFLVGFQSVYTDDSFSIITKSDGTYEIGVEGQPWLQSAPSFLQSDGKQYSTKDGTLKLTYTPERAKGMDKLGSWDMMNYTYSVQEDLTRVNFNVRAYKELPIAIFSQTFRQGASKANVGDANKVSSAFPAFQIGNGGDIGFMAYGGLMSGDIRLKFGKWNSKMERLPDGLECGPLVLFDRSGNVLVISAFSQFMSSSFWHDTNTSTINYGIMGLVDDIPDGHSMETIVYYSSEGINEAMVGWGRILRKWYGKDIEVSYQDPTVKYLGYWTDDGAYYYHATEPKMNYEDTLLMYQEYSRKMQVPFRYIQLDDWWYYIQGTQASGYGATVTWEAMPSIFPNGLSKFFNKTEWPVLAHNRFWSKNTTYAKQNGGPFDFIIDGDLALPVDQAFWDHLFANGVQWGLAVYEQDWMNFQVENIGMLQSDIQLGRKWLLQMGEAASRYGLRVQYCMALSREVMQTLEIPTVTQSRVSGDYLVSGDENWQIGVSSMFAHAVGLAPYKDNFWTTSEQPGNRYKLTEPNPHRELVVALLSTGPVGPGDKIGYTDNNLVAKAHALDGLLLKPCKPATAIDLQIHQRAFGGGIGPQGEVYTTYSYIDGFVFGIIFASNLKESFKITPRTAGFGKYFDTSLLISDDYDPMNETEKPVPFSNVEPLELTPDNCGNGKFCLYHTFPIISYREFKVGLMGDLTKIVPMSADRVTGISSGENDLQVYMKGTPGEKFSFFMYYPSFAQPVICEINGGGTATFSFNNRSCM